ncbi:MAG: aldehyde dehydrogenase family protein [Pseudomonadales bacterium]
MTSAEQVQHLVANARRAQKEIDSYSQAQVDELVTAAAWALMKPANNERLATLAVEETGLGKIADKITKNHRKTLGLLRDLQDAKTVGIINEKPELGLVEIARPVGVVGVIVPSTNPVATPMNNILNALKCRNAIILSPSPKGQPSCARLLELIYAELDRINAPRDLVQQLPAPVNKELSQELLKQVDLIVATGSQNNVRAAYTSGTPAFGVGAGNVAVIVDETADLTDAAAKITASKTFDNATSCSSENSLIVLDSIYDDAIAALVRCGADMLSVEEKQSLQEVMWQEGRLNPAVLAKPCSELASIVGLSRKESAEATFLMVEETNTGKSAPFSGEKMSLVLTIYRAKDFSHAKQIARDIFSYQGAGHSLGLHSSIDDRALELGFELPVSRVIVNQAHCFATGGSFDNGLPFSLSMGCGTWGGNVTDENVHYKHFMNITRVARTIEPREISADDYFEAYRKKHELF